MEENGLACRSGEALRASSNQTLPTASAHGAPPSSASDDSTSASSQGSGRRTLLWSVAGALLNGVGFIALALFEQYNDSLVELHNDLKHFNETSGEFVKEARLQRCTEQIKESIREMHAAGVARAEVERRVKADELARNKTIGELQRLGERLASLEGRQASAPIIVPFVARTKKQDTPR